MKNVAIVSKKNKNKYGQYFTPKLMADFMVSLTDISQEAKVLEPACGEGIFLKCLQEKGFQQLFAFEIDNTLALDFDMVCYESFVAANITNKFDLIIGNPPYIRWKNLETELKEELNHSALWQKHFNSLCDYLYIFILKSIEILKDGGQLIFICPEYWLNTTHSLSLRNYMVSNGYFECIYHFNETPIFDNAAVSVIVFKYIKSKRKSKHINITKYYKNRVLTKEIINKIADNSVQDKDIERFEVAQFQINERWLLTKSDIVNDIEQFERACSVAENARNDLFGHSTTKKYACIGDICDIGNGMVSGLDKAFQWNEPLLNEQELLHSIEVIKAKNLSPFKYSATIRYIFVNELEDEQLFEQHFPNFYTKLFPLKDRLNKRYQYNRKIPYWQWVFLRNYQLFSSPKPRIFVPCKERISNKDYFRFAFVEKNIYPTQDVTALFLKENTKESIFYVLAFLNNHRVFKWLSNKGIIKGNIVEFSEKPLASIPFRKIDWKKEEEVSIHQQITSICKEFVDGGSDVLLEEINVLFDKLLN